MRSGKFVTSSVLVILTTISVLSIGTFPKVHAPTIGGNQYSLNPLPAYAQEGTAISLVLTVTLGISSGTTNYQFRFYVRDPAGTTFQSQPMNHTAYLGQTEFTVVVVYPGQYISGINSRLGKYVASVDQILPSQITAANSSFVLGVTDSSSYERTQTVNVQATGYNASENVGVTIKTQLTSVTVFSQTVSATSTGIVGASWKILRNATTLENYVVSLSGTTTHKSIPDVEIFSVRTATMYIASIMSEKTTYQRTDSMEFSFQPTYPDGSIPSTGNGALSLAGPTGKSLTLYATYATASQTFNASYTTTTTNQTGTWTASLGTHGYGDAYGNTGPGVVLTNTPQLTPAILSISVTTNTIVSVGQQLRFNATVTYPDGTPIQSGSVRAYLIYTGAPAINDTVPIVYDSGLGLWVGTYTARGADVGGLWSLIVLASDSATPTNSGTATRAITIQNGSIASSSFPLYYFGILAAIIAGILMAALLVFKRRRVTHTRLKIDLDAVHSEAGRIESQDFFKTIKDQVRKEKEE